MTEFWANLNKNKKLSSTKKFLTAIEEAKEWKNKFDSMQVCSTISLNSDDESNPSPKKRERNEIESIEEDVISDSSDDILDYSSKRSKNNEDNDEFIEEIKFKEIEDNIIETTPEEHREEEITENIIETTPEEHREDEEITENIVPSSLNSQRSNEEEFVDPFAPTQPYHHHDDPIADYEAPTQPFLPPTQELLSTPSRKARHNGGHMELISDVHIDKIVRKLKIEMEKSVQEKMNEWIDKLSHSIDKKIEALEKSMKNLYDTFNKSSKALSESTEQIIKSILKKEREFNLNIMHKSFQDCETLFNTLHKNISLLKEYDYKK